MSGALFFVYYTADFEVALVGYRRRKKRGIRGLSPAQSARRTAGRSACPADSRNRQNPYPDTVGNGSTLGKSAIHDTQLDPKPLKPTPNFLDFDPLQKARSDRLCRAL